MRGNLDGAATIAMQTDIEKMLTSEGVSLLLNTTHIRTTETESVFRIFSIIEYS